MVPVIKEMLAMDWQSVAEIYREGIATGMATFQQEAPIYREWDNAHLKCCRLVAFSEDKLVGWAALTAVSGRCVYAGVAEVSVYVSAAHRGQGFGATLIEHLILEREKEGLWTLQAGIFTGNIPSIKIHEQGGFRKVGYRERIGKLNGDWRDIMLFERRSKLIGVD